MNGQRGEIAGEFTRMAGPPVWPWILLAVLPLVARAAVLLRRLRPLPAAIALGAVAAAATLAGFAAAGLAASTERWLLFGLEIAVVVAALLLLARRRFPLGALSVLPAFAVLQALSGVAVFRHAGVGSALPAEVVHGAVSVSLGCGVALGLLAYRGLEAVAAPSGVRNPRAATTRRRET